MQEKYLNK